ncbi:MAG: mandelate racemase, partial [Alphaproteobacteria bacterium]|nr:mandelate racemase [Alphaproteobacteria bacterium]
MTAPEVRVREVRLYEWPFVLRLPFRFGAITVTHGRQAVLRLRLSLADGREGWGVAAETLAAKWFDKDPKIADDDNVDQLRAALEIASDIYQRNGARTPYGHFVSAYGPQISAGVRRRLNPLVASFGPALLDRAIADAVGKLLSLSFYDLARKNVLGLRPTPATPDLPGFDFDRFLAGLAPSATIHARHTVGMVDPITAADQAPGTRVEDGLPETLEDIVATYGHRYYKLKVGGNVAADIARLTRIAAVLDRQSHRYHATLDGNEQYGDAAAVLELWKAIEATPALSRLRQSILFVEQPIRRARALAESVDALAARVPVILDESDGEIASFLLGKALGYAGVSSKNCKGFYKAM